MLSLAELYAPVAADIQRGAEIFRRELVSDQDFIADLCQHVEQFHGKQLRPALLLLVARACGRVQPEHHILAAVVEMVHIATLVHDDVLDDADIRRRAATVNRLWGTECAVLTGDFLFSHAFTLCSSLASPFAAQVIGRTAIRLCEGEMMQDANCHNYALSEREYFEIIERKTASLIAACGLLGAHYAGADPAVVHAMEEFGRSLGIAFQITDDVLDLVGDEAQVGKSLGRDVHKGKVTLPVIHFLRNAPADQCEQVRTILSGQDPHRYRTVAGILTRGESIEYALTVAGQYAGRAREALALLEPSDARESLEAMADFVLTRQV